jgi:hypothetical protein
MLESVHQIMVWIPDNMSDNNKALNVTQTMINRLKVKKINSASYRSFKQLFKNSNSNENILFVLSL